MPKEVALAGSFDEFRNWCGEKRLNPNDFIVVSKRGDELRVAGLEYTTIHRIGTWDKLPKDVIACVESRVRPRGNWVKS